MKKTVSRDIEVPDGDYCVDYRDIPRAVRCTSLRSETVQIGWEDGLGSPGSLTHYRCAAFDTGLSPDTGFRCLVVRKCQACCD
jgi:hypothetical protein